MKHALVLAAVFLAHSGFAHDAQTKTQLIEVNIEDFREKISTASLIEVGETHSILTHAYFKETLLPTFEQFGFDAFILESIPHYSYMKSAYQMLWDPSHAKHDQVRETFFTNISKTVKFGVGPHAADLFEHLLGNGHFVIGFVPLNQRGMYAFDDYIVSTTQLVRRFAKGNKYQACDKIIIFGGADHNDRRGRRAGRRLTDLYGSEYLTVDILSRVKVQKGCDLQKKAPKGFQIESATVEVRDALERNQYYAEKICGQGLVSEAIYRDSNDNRFADYLVLVD